MSNQETEATQGYELLVEDKQSVEEIFAAARRFAKEGKPLAAMQVLQSQRASLVHLGCGSRVDSTINRNVDQYAEGRLTIASEFAKKGKPTEAIRVLTTARDSYFFHQHGRWKEPFDNKIREYEAMLPSN